ncbi:uncharacterized protein JCM15063_003209 [Sporobolomyces koalae]|uniref:uncharacterized protein n=1 Tax=Sporobolomyces koalae TaxID=500713 RepID=UPI003181F16E
MELDVASQAQLAAFLLSQNQHVAAAAPHAPAMNVNPTLSPEPLSTASSPFDPVQALAALQWATPAAEINHTELDGWLQEQLNALTQLPLPNPSTPATPIQPVPLHHASQHTTPQPTYPAPAQPHAFPPISASRFHPYDRHQSKPAPDRPRWHAHQHQSAPNVPQYPSHAASTMRQPVLYPPDDSPRPLVLSQATSPRSVPPHPTLPTPMDSTPSYSPSRLDCALPNEKQKLKRRRTRSLPALPTFSKLESQSNADQLETLFDWMDERRWNMSQLVTALSEPSNPANSAGSDGRTPTHQRRIREFLNLDSTVSANDSTGETWESRLRRWKRARKLDNEGEKGADAIVRMWEEQGGLGRKFESEKGMEEAVRELHVNGDQQGPVAGVAIRSVINRYHEAYNEAQADIARLDAALSRVPSPHLTSAPRDPAAWSGQLVISPVQADLLSHWLMSPGRPDLQEERAKGSIEADHMRNYSSLSPIDLHARGAEVCRTILARDESTRSLFGQYWDSVHLFSQGPVIAPIDTAGFQQYDDYSLWHHALMTYLQLCVRYPAFRDSKEAQIVISPDLPPPVHPTALETSLIDRLLRSHWDYLRLYLLNEHGGLLRSAVRGFEGVKLSRFDLLSVVGDTIEVIEALKKSRDTSDRILPYDTSVSQIRNAWRQRAFWDPQASWVVWSAATTHFLELSALNKEWAQGVKDLPGIEGLISSSKTAASQAMR